MKRFIIVVITALTTNVSGQQLTSTVNNANGDSPNIFISNPNAANITNDPRATIFLDNDGRLKFRCVTGKGFAFRDSGNTFDQFAIDGAGNVGIGITSPQSSLHVAGSSSTAPELNIDHYFDNFGASTIEMRKARGTQAAPAIVATGDYISSWEGWAYTGSAFRRSSYVGSVVTGTPTSVGVPTDLIFATSSGGQDALEGMRLDKNGNLGVGTTTPTEKLSVNGKIRSKEVKVEATNWPDYVFAKEYRLPSLPETEKQIKEQGHLPGIPSAADVKANGVDLGEMNGKLLQKIEELTLYLIELKKDNDDQRSLNLKQQKQLETQGQLIQKILNKK